MDASLFFTSPTQAQFLEQLRQQVEAPTSLALVTGPKGAGKTSLWFRFLGQAPRQWRLFRLDANPLLYPEQLLNALALLFHGQLNPNDPGLREQLPAAFLAVRQEGRLPVLVVDDAEDLPLASLALLLDFHGRREDGQTPPFVLVLLAKPQIQDNLTAPEVQAVLAQPLAPLPLPLLGAEQLAPYIQHMLRVKGIRRIPMLTDEQLHTIQEAGEGLPGRVNGLVMGILREAGRGRPSRAPVSRKNLILILTLALGGGMLLTLGWLFQEDLLGRLRQGMDMPSPLIPSAQLDLPMAASQEPPSPPVAPDPTDQSQAATVQPIPEQASRWSGPLDTVSGQPPSDSTVSSQPASLLVHLRKRDWLLKQRREAYTLQILAVADEQALQKFIGKHRIQSQAYYLEIRRPDRSWFFLLHGVYPNRQSAQAALAQLPPPLRQAGAWPRPLGGVQDEIRALDR